LNFPKRYYRVGTPCDKNIIPCGNAKTLRGLFIDL